MSDLDKSHAIAIWNDSERALLDWLLDEILPATADGALPAGGALGVASYIAARMHDSAGFGELCATGLSKTSVLVAERLQALDVGELSALPAATRTELARAVEAAEPRFFAALIKHAYMGYYTHPLIPPRMGLPDRPPQPLGHKVPKDSLASLEALLAPVRARGKCYRDAD